MNEKAKAWLAALRSGNYEQTMNLLHDSRGFCCLGVACDVIGGPDAWTPNDAEVGSFTHLGSAFLLPEKIADEMNFRRLTSVRVSSEEYDELTAKSKSMNVRRGEGSPWCTYVPHETHSPFFVELTHLNDLAQLSFSDIADFIEKHQEELFYDDV